MGTYDLGENAALGLLANAAADIAEVVGVAGRLRGCRRRRKLACATSGRRRKGNREKELTAAAAEADNIENVGGAALGAGVENAILADTVAGGDVGGHSEDAGDEGSNNDELHLGG